MQESNGNEPAVESDLPVVEMAESDTFDAASSLMPYFDGDAHTQTKGHYLTYRYTGFSVREATELAGIHQSTVMRWRNPEHYLYDEKFVQLEQGCIGLSRAKFRTEVLAMLISRNFHLYLMRDAEAITRVLRLARDPKTNILIEPTKEDHNWAAKARGFYTAQQLESIDSMTNPKKAEATGPSIIEMILRRRTETEEVHIFAQTTGSPTETSSPLQPADSDAGEISSISAEYSEGASG